MTINMSRLSMTRKGSVVTPWSSHTVQFVGLTKALYISPPDKCVQLNPTFTSLHKAFKHIAIAVQILHIEIHEPPNLSL